MIRTPYPLAFPQELGQLGLERPRDPPFGLGRRVWTGAVVSLLGVALTPQLRRRNGHQPEILPEGLGKVPLCASRIERNTAILR